ncbi:hypothetical protein RU639_008660 [Aspergillus parasiticus]
MLKFLAHLAHKSRLVMVELRVVKYRRDGTIWTFRSTFPDQQSGDGTYFLPNDDHESILQTDTETLQDSIEKETGVDKEKKA